MEVNEKPLQSIRALLEKYGVFIGIAVLFFVIAALLLISWPTEEVDSSQVAHTYPVIKLVQASAVILFLLLGVISIIAAVFREVFRHDLREALRVIAWEGVGDAEVVDLYPKRKVTVLEYVRGIEKASHLRYEQCLFDVLVADVELLRRHNMPENRGRLVHLAGDLYKPLWDHVWTPLANIARDLGGHLGIPIRFGLNDIVVNREHVPSTLCREPLSYKDFALGALVTQPDYHIGLWNWYLPTLSVLLLTEGVPITEVRHQKASSAEFSRIASAIAQHPDRFICFDDPRELSDFLVQGYVALVLGGSGCFMPLNPPPHLKAVIPSEGALMWIECAAVIHTTNDATDASLFINHLLADDIQKVLINRHAYRAFPATAKVLRETVSSGVYKSFNLNAIYDPNGWQKGVQLYPRYLPEDWRAWEQSWEEITKSVRIV